MEQQKLLHITHARQDDAWVHGVLVPALGLTEEQYWTRAEDDLDALKLEDLERAVRACRYTLLVASSAARVDEWTQFAGTLAQHLGIEEGKPRLLLVARDFDPESKRGRELLPLRQRCLVCLDCSDAERSATALATLAAQLAVTTTDEPPTVCPYPGLRMFGTGDPASCFNRTDLFFGRDEEGRAIVEKLRRSGRVLLVGPSGCGKSSLVRARVLPALGQSADAMATVAERPGTHPEASLRSALDALDPRLGPAIDAYLGADEEPTARATLIAAVAGSRRLLYLDQFEEVFLDDTDEHGERARFFARLSALGHVSGMAIMLSMRADFYGDLMRCPAWDEFKDHRIELAPLRGEALRLAITRPAEVVGVHVEADLVERLVREADSDRAAEALPLLQVALEQLWAHREWRYLSLASYARIADGDRRGLDVVLARHADASIAALAEPAQALARRVLIDLVHLGEGRPDTRRRRSVSEIRRAGDDDDALAQVLDHLSALRLIAISAETSVVVAMQVVTLQATNANDTNGGGAVAASASGTDAERHVDLAHDTLIAGWPALAGWISTRRDDLRTQRRLEARIAGGGLLAASELPEFTRWVAWIATPAGKLLGASDALRALIRHSVRFHRNRRRRLFGGLFAVIAVLAVATGIALWQRDLATDNAAEAIRQRNLAVNSEKRATANAVELKQQLARSYQETGRQLLLEGRPSEAILYLLEARKAGQAEAPLRMLFAAAARHLPLWLEHQSAVSSAAFSPDGSRIVTASWDRTARVWDAITGKALCPPIKHQDVVSSVAFSRDGSRIVTASWDHTARIWDAAMGKPLSPPLRHQDPVLQVAFSTDSTRFVTASGRTALIWNAATSKPLALPLEHQDIVSSAAFSPDSTRIITASRDQTARVWDATTGKPLTPPLKHQGEVNSAAFSPDGTRIVTASRDNTARIWDATTGKPLTPPLAHQGIVNSAAFSPDGTRVVTASGDRTARIWDTATGKPLALPLEHQGSVGSAAFSPDGTRIVTASDDRTARIWDAATGRPSAPPLELQIVPWSAAFSPDGTRIITTGEDMFARVMDATAAMPVALLFKQRDVLDAGFSPDGTRIATASGDHTARVWNATTGKPMTPPLEHLGKVWNVAFSPDGTRIVTASEDKTARVWDATTGKPLTPPLEHQGIVGSSAFSPDGTRIVTASNDKTARVWDAVIGTPLAGPFRHQGFVSSAEFSPDGTRIVTASEDMTACVWDATTGTPVARNDDHQDIVNSAAFSPDGTRIVTASNDLTARIWSATTGKPLTPPLNHQARVRSAAFSPDGKRVVTASSDKTARIWDAITGKPLTPPLEHQAGVSTAVFSPDGTRIVTASDDKTACVWDGITGKPLAPPLEHEGSVEGAAFSPNSARVITVSENTARVWDTPIDQGTVADWAAIAERSPYLLVNGVLSQRPSRAAGDSSSKLPN